MQSEYNVLYTASMLPSSFTISGLEMDQIPTLVVSIDLSSVSVSASNIYKVPTVSDVTRETVHAPINL